MPKWQRRRRRRRSQLIRSRRKDPQSPLPEGIGFGMPPAAQDTAETSHASDAGKLDTTPRTATATIGRGREEDNLARELKDKYSFNRYDYVAPAPTDTPNVLGRLRARVDRWEEMGASEFILDTLKSGYKLPLVDNPDSKCFKNNKSALRNQIFVDQAIEELQTSGRIIKVGEPPRIVNPLSVSENGEKKRLILDLRYVNQHLWKQRVKFEDFKVFRNFLKKGSFMFHFDFRSGQSLIL